MTHYDLYKKKYRCKDTGEVAVGYIEYLKTTHWYGMIQAHRKPSCDVCGGTEKIHLHHKTYLRVGKEEAKDLMSLCDSCHHEFHIKLKQIKRELKKEIHDFPGARKKRMYARKSAENKLYKTMLDD